MTQKTALEQREEMRLEMKCSCLNVGPGGSGQQICDYCHDVMRDKRPDDRVVIVNNGTADAHFEFEDW